MTEEVQSIVSFSTSIAEAEAPEPLPVGTYEAIIEAASVQISKAGNPYFRVSFRVPVDNYPADFDVENEPEGVLLMWNGLQAVDTPRTRFRLRKFLEAIDADMGNEIDVNDWLGRTAQVVVGHELWEGIDRARVERVVSDD